ncbi:MAG: dipeptide ABC transporter ATP-binding protein [Deltaproteobacteria bacterium]|nr:dipeptide ABC transporter ATP-binding protein [Deltaproteobacteria bacterium]MBW2016919.1 dipeptide ABC transporter ATP-binding protein [Deltaproteobacteria bacterium]MBW2129383.1 dipeptide ABC transporter ATP-binding protein [Deltaproteobacteria bacterium]MBW2303725.1 dipeptide ABC transporter ATP-binding protein [Deltaproteobacteria bacterium]
MNRDALLKIEELKKYFPIGGGFFRKPKHFVKAVDGVSLTIRRGETFGLVGESGCGKTTIGRCILRLEEPTGGRILFEGRDIAGLNRSEMRTIRRDMQIIFQDPYSSLNPRKTVGRIIGEAFAVHGLYSRDERKKRREELAALVGLRPEHVYRYPHEFSGGQRQRVCVARALALSPKLIIADEPVSALDVSIQAQILNLLLDLQSRFSLTYLFISHDLSVVRHICDRVAVMYLGRIVELADRNALFTRPGHPYTRALLSAVPKPDPFVPRKPRGIRGEVPSQVNPPGGCAFHPRCSDALPQCSEIRPELIEIEPGHWAACHRV